MQLSIGRSKLDARILERFQIKEIGIDIPGIESTVYIRSEHTDSVVFGKIFLRQEYLPRNFPIPNESVLNIIDAGANVGYATLWFRLQYPNARIIAIEPDPTNFAQLKRNCGNLPNVELIQGALWGQDGELALQFEHRAKSLGSWGTRTVPPGSVTGTERIRALTLDTIMEHHGLVSIDYLKLDIEGAEKDVFECQTNAWLAKTRLIVAEFHDAFRPGATAAATAALSTIPHEKYRQGENWFFELNPG